VLCTACRKQGSSGTFLGTLTLGFIAMAAAVKACVRVRIALFVDAKGVRGVSMPELSTTWIELM